MFFFSIYSIQSLKLFSAHQTRGDLTNFAQAMWNSTQGRMMQNTFNYSVHNFWSDPQIPIPKNSNIFGIHLNPILFAFLPIYILFPFPQTLLIIQSFLITSSGIILFFISKRLLKNNLLSILLQLSLLGYFPLVSSVLSEFHAFSLSIFFGLLLIYASVRSNHQFYLISLALFLFVQENTAISTIFFGLFLSLKSSTRKIGLITTIVSIIYFYLCIKVIIPSFSNYGHYLFENTYGSPLGNSLNEIFINSVRNPVLLFKTLITPQNIKYLTSLLLPLSPLIIFSPTTVLVSLSALATNLLSGAAILKSQMMHYESLAIPFLYYTLLLGINNILLFIPSKQKATLYTCTILVIIFSFLGYRKFTSTRINYHVLTQNLYQPLDKDIDELISSIPTNASVSTQDYLSGHLSNRQELYLFPVYFQKVDYVLVSTIRTWPLTQEENDKYIKQLTDKNHQIIAQKNNLVLIQKTNPGF